MTEPLESQITTLCESVGASVYDMETLTENERTIFRVYITAPGGVSVELCAQVSRLLSPLLDVTPPVSGEYFLEVSSPGLERKLKAPRHYLASIGENVKLTFVDGSIVKGTLGAYDGEQLTIKTEHGDEIFPTGQILKAATYIDW